ncbi:Cytochrome P450 [Arabidopsis thaliana x Arabidopsis arenosa]|uniref:Cytochrome P450 n=1 Tax=Arabidopsis thaliana x Arabidopsis arenosa TaxID=1240361 RepID=A0A8T2AYY5_9BRAS|nr:Cytochrome P450 [Arabidopsis thaliana x Arabidopsis arenosa]
MCHMLFTLSKARIAALIILGFQNCLFFLLLCFFSLLCYSLFFKKPNGSRSDFDLPPSPPSLPIIGHLHLLLSTLTHKTLQKLSFKYGSLIRLRILNIPIVLVSSASVAYEIFRTHDMNISFRGSPPIHDSLFVGSWSFIFSPYGDHWKFMKKLMVTKLLGSQALERSRGVRADELERFYKSLLDEARKKESVDIVKETMKLSNNIICKMIVGRSCSEENGEAEKARGLASESIALGNKIVLGSMLRPPFKKLVTSLFKKDMMDLLFAGTDTTAQTTQWTMAEIINKPNILERLREEIDSVVGKTRLIQETDLPKLPYLQAVVKEVLRLHPPGSFFARDPDYWEDPDEFKPERFLLASSSRSRQDDERREKALQYIPFGGGRRGCPGENLAYVILGTVVGMMVQGFEWRIKGEKVDLEESIKGLTLTMAHPPKFTPGARNSNYSNLNLQS